MAFAILLAHTRRMRFVCKCGHDWTAHRHYRRGTDCSCGCERFRLRVYWKRGAPTGTAVSTVELTGPEGVTVTEDGALNPK
jgi:hypothetical protein